MKIAIVQSTDHLERLVLYTKQFTDSVQTNSIDELKKEKKVEVIVMNQGELKHTDITQLRSDFPSKKILIVTESIEPFFEKICIAHDIMLISKEWSERDQLDTIQRVWFGLEEQTEYHNVIAIQGTHRQVGVTQTALSIGHTLGTYNYKTLVIGLNPYNPGEDHKKKSTYSFDLVYDLIQSNIITDGASLLPYLEEYKHFFYLPGNRDFYRAQNFDKKPVQQLIQYAKDYFQVVILDVGSFYDSYLSLTGLELSNTHILVSSQEQYSLDEYKRWNEQVLSLFEFKPKLRYQVVNKFASKAIITNSHLEEKNEIPILTQIPFFPEANDALIEDGILCFAEYKHYNKAIDGIAKVIGDEIIYASTFEKKGTSLFSGLLFGKGKVK